MRAMCLHRAVASLALITPALGSHHEQQLLTNSRNDYPRLNFSSPSPLIFHSTFSLLQQWPNTFFPYGHTIAPCSIPRHTSLYHAHQNADFPESPEWFAFDASMAYSILGALPNSHLLTFRTTKEVKCLYFDGTSAALMDPGSMDSQMLFLHNDSAHIPGDERRGQPQRPPPGNHTRPPPGRDGSRRGNPLVDEYDRAHGLCHFIKEKNLGGPGWGYEGIVRMNAAFELIWCNFTSPSAKLVSWLNVSALPVQGTPSPFPGDDGPHPPRRGAPGWSFFDQPFRGRSAYEWFISAAKTYGFAGGLPGRGEARVKIDSCGLFTFYDEALSDQASVRMEAEKAKLNLTADGVWKPPAEVHQREIAHSELSRRRRFQRAANVSTSDGKYMRHEVEQRMRDSLSTQGRTCSGIDWVLVSQTIVTDYSSDIHELRHLLSVLPPPATNETVVRNWLSVTRGLSHHLYMPFYEYPVFTSETLDFAFSPVAPQSLEALARCKDQHALISSPDELSASENATYKATTEILSAICTILLPIFLSIENLWLANFNNVSAPPDLPDNEGLAHTISSVTHRNSQVLNELIAWLGWADQWTYCEPGCGLGQVCAIPIWPVMGIGHFSGPDGDFGRWRPDVSEQGWLEAKCVDIMHGWYG